MNLVYVTRHFSFEAAHYLPLYVGKCNRLHGHSYKMDVTVSAKKDFSNSPCKDAHDKMVLDFSILASLVNREIISKFDHTSLNDYFPVPTAEAMVVDFFESLSIAIQKAYHGDVMLEEVKLWETEDSCATYRG